MSNQTTAQKSIKRLTGIVLTLGVIVSFGILSFCGMMAIVPSIALACASFILAGVIEGQVFLVNIMKGLYELSWLGKPGEKALLAKDLDLELKAFIKDNNSPNKPSEFLKEYREWKEYLLTFEHKELDAKQKQERERAISHINNMHKALFDEVNNNKTITQSPYYGDLVTKFKTKLPTIHTKLQHIRFGALLSVISGIGFGFATASSLMTTASFIGPSITIALWPLSIIASVGYAFLIYHTMVDLICNDTISKWQNKISTWFTRKTENGLSEKDLPFRLRVVTASLLLPLGITLSIAAMLATAGTWWTAVKEGVALIPSLTRFTNIIRNITVPTASLTSLAFMIRNSFKSIKTLIKKLDHFIENAHIPNPITSFKNAIDNRRKKESWGQILNPFRLIYNIISAPYLFVVFVGHLIAVGLTGDRVEGLEIPCAAAGTASEFLTDFDYFTDHHHKPKAYKSSEEGHTHGNIPELSLKIMLFPILMLSGCWAWAMSTTNTDKPISLLKSIKKQFTNHEHAHYVVPATVPTLSTTMQIIDIERRFKKLKTQTTETLALNNMAEAKDSLIRKIQNQDKQVTYNKVVSLFKNPSYQAKESVVELLKLST